jgi:hypothetical protein
MDIKSPFFKLAGIACPTASLIQVGKGSTHITNPEVIAHWIGRTGPARAWNKCRETWRSAIGSARSAWRCCLSWSQGSRRRSTDRSQFFLIGLTVPDKLLATADEVIEGFVRLRQRFVSSGLSPPLDDCPCVPNSRRIARSGGGGSHPRAESRGSESRE